MTSYTMLEGVVIDIFDDVVKQKFEKEFGPTVVTGL